MENNKLQLQLKKLREPDFSKEIVIDKLFANKEMVDAEYRRIIQEYGDKVTNEIIANKLNESVLRANLIGEAIKILLPCFEFIIDDNNLNMFIKVLKTNPALAKQPDDFIKAFATQSIKHQMLFAFLAKEWNITVTQDDINFYVERMSRLLKKPPQVIAQDKGIMSSAAQQIVQEKIGNEMIGRLNVKIDWDAIKAHSQQMKEKQNEKAEEKGDGVIVER